MEDGVALEEVASQGQEVSGGQQVAVVNEHSETIYIQLPPNITLDDNSIVTTETTEDGHQIFRVIGLSEQSEDSLQQDGDASAQHGHQDMELNGQGVTFMAAGVECQEVISMDTEFQGQEIGMDGESEEVNVVDNGGQEVIVTGGSDQEIMVAAGDGIREVESRGHEVTISYEVTAMELGGQEVTDMEPDGQDVATMESVSQEVTIIEPDGQEVATMESGSHEVPLVEQWVMMQKNIKGAPRVEPTNTNSYQDMPAFQEVLTVCSQQNDGVVVAEGENDRPMYIVSHLKVEAESVAGPQQVPAGEVIEKDTQVAESTETIQIINPETGKVEAVSKSCLESSVSVPQMAELAVPTDVAALTILQPDPIIIAPLKRGRGRPRKDRNAQLPPQPIRPPAPKEEEPVGPPGPGGRPRRKAAIKFFKKWEAIRQDLGIDKLEADSQRSPPECSEHIADAQSLEKQRAAKEKRAQAAKERKAHRESLATKDHPAIVNVTVKDKTTLQVMSDIGIHMLYYCRRCTFFSTQIMAVTNHILACRERIMTEQDRNQAANAAHTSAVLVNAALQDIAKSSQENTSTVDEDDNLIQIDEHNYAAEVDQVEAEPTGIQCHMCNERVELDLLSSHLREVHADCDGEEATRRLEKVQGKQQETPMAETAIPTLGGEIIADGIVADTTSNEVTTVTHEEGPVKLESEPEASTNDPRSSLANDGSTRATTEGEVAMMRTKFRCPHHNVVFSTQASLTQHYIEKHWGVTKEKVAASEALKQRVKRERENKVLVKKRGRGRPRKYPVAVVKSVLKVEDQDANKDLLSDDDKEGDEHDDDVKDPDFDINATSDTGVTTPHKGWPEFHERGSGAKCVHCYKRFATPGNLKLHMKHQHTGDKLLPVPCHFCNKYFKNKVQLRNHVRCVHEGMKRRYVYKHYPVKKKVFMCEECGYTTPELCRLKNHKLSVHEGQYPYVCEICDYKTNEKADMRRHEHKHQGIKRYPCGYCSYRSDQRWLLVNHCQRQHSVRLDRHSRNTRGSFWSNRRTRKEEANMEQQANNVAESSDQLHGTDLVAMDANAPIAYTQEIIIEQGINSFSENPGDSYLVPMVTTNEHGEEEMAMYAVHRGVGDQEGAMYAVRQGDGNQERVMYAVRQDDGDQDGATYAMRQDDGDQEGTTYTMRQDDGDQEGATYAIREDDGDQEGAMYAVRQDDTDHEGAMYMVQHDGGDQEGAAMYVVRHENGEPDGAVYMVEHNVSEQEVAIETIEEEAPGDDVVYIQEDGTVLEREQAALMLLAVGPTPGSLQTDGAVQVETNYL